MKGGAEEKVHWSRARGPGSTELAKQKRETTRRNLEAATKRIRHWNAPSAIRAPYTPIEIYDEYDAPSWSDEDEPVEQAAAVTKIMAAQLEPLDVAMAVMDVDEASAERLGQSDQALPLGTRIYVKGHGVGDYFKFNSRGLGYSVAVNNEHKIAFSSGPSKGTVQTVRLGEDAHKSGTWSVRSNRIEEELSKLRQEDEAAEKRLLAMGFVKADAVAALAECGGDVERAIERLLASRQASETTLAQRMLNDFSATGIDPIGPPSPPDRLAN